jgi:hypothetical protein
MREILTDSRGKILSSVIVTNRIDQALAEDRKLLPVQVRSVEIDNVLIDPRGMNLCLPADVIAVLGLKLLKEVNAATAIGIRRVRMFQDATISLCGREGTFECLELPQGRDALLGIVPMQALGLEADMHNQRVRILPTTSVDTYLTIPGIELIEQGELK